MRSDYMTIVNADDFGYDMSINKAILASFRSSLITRASLMVNMPGFEYAVQMVRNYSFLSGKIGLHVNLTEGYPLSETIRSCNRFCDANGQFIYKRQKPIFFLTRREQKAVYQEMKAQIEKAIRAGIHLSHLDSHHHVHTEWALMKLLIRLSKEYGVRNIRITRNMGHQRRLLYLIYKTFFNSYLRHYPGISVTDYFGDMDDLSHLMEGKPPGNKSIEIMVHPKFNEKEELVDYDGKNLQEKLAPLMDRRYAISPTDL